MSGPLAANPGYANRYGCIDVQASFGFNIRNAGCGASDGTGPTAYPLTTTGGVQTTAPNIYAYANAAGVIKGAAILYPGDYTTGNPPTAMTCAACSGSPTFTFTTGTTPFGQLGITGVTVTAGGSANNASTGMVPVTFNNPSGGLAAVVIDGFSWNWGLSGSRNISSLIATDSVNASGFNRAGYTILNDTGYFNAENGGNLFGSTVNHANENSNREWVQFMCPSAVSGACLSGAVSTIGATGSYSVPIVSFP